MIAAQSSSTLITRITQVYVLLICITKILTSIIIIIDERNIQPILELYNTVSAGDYETPPSTLATESNTYVSYDSNY